jgi:hypothetical protein
VGQLFVGIASAKSAASGADGNREIRMLSLRKLAPGPGVDLADATERNCGPGEVMRIPM